jgi:2-methylaconitate cis-trans-isomerase PrpF
MGNCHRAFPLTVAMCLAVAARIPGTVVAECLEQATHDPIRVSGPRSNDVRLGHPSGVLPIASRVSTEGGEPRAETVTVYRTARRLMEGFVRVP